MGITGLGVVASGLREEEPPSARASTRFRVLALGLRI